MPSISFTGCPLPSPVVIEKVTECETYGEPHWSLTRDQARQLLEAWCDAPRAKDSDTYRAFEIFEIGLIVTALHLDGETTLSGWESATGSHGTDIYSTENMPFDFEIATI